MHNFFKIFCVINFLIAIAHSSLFSIQRWSVPTNLQNLNSEKDEFAPYWDKWNEILYFNSTRNNYSQYFISARVDSINFTNPKLVQDKLNKVNSNRSYITMLSPEEGIISAFSLYKRRSYLNLHKVFRTGNIWGEPILEDSLKCECFVSHPTISPDGKMLIFTSDRFSENGDTDLWMAVRQDDGTWGSLIKLSEINSPGNEITPFLASNDTLYFATDGQIGPGGFDIYYSVLIDGIWQRPKPLIEINTEYDESDPMILPSGELIFASNRPGGKGSLDLYLSIPITDEYQIKIVKEPEIETYISSLQMKLVTQYEFFPVVPFIWANNIFNKGIFLYGGIGQKNQKDLVSADSIYVSSLSLIANRLKYLKDAILYIYPANFQSFDKVSYYRNKNLDYEIKIEESEYKSPIKTINDLKELLIKGFSIDSSRIEISKELKDTDTIFYLFSNKSELFQPIRVIWQQAEIQPPFLELLVNAESNDLLGCDCFFVLDNDSLLVRSRVNIYEKLRININDYNNFLINLDALKVSINCRYKNGITKTRDLDIPIIKSKIEGRKIHKNEKQFTRHIFILNDISDIDRLPNYRAEFEELLQFSANSRKIRIIYFDIDNQRAKNTAESFAKKLKSSLKSPPPIELTSLRESQILEISRQLRPYVIQILLEK